jgi:O-antigen ligase
MARRIAVSSKLGSTLRVDFTVREAKPALVHYRPVVDYIPMPVALDPLWTMIFLAVFIATIALVAKRASYGIAALILTQPFLFSHYVGDTTVTLPKVVLLGVLVGLGAQPEWRDVLRVRPVRAILIAAAAYAGVVAVSIAVAAHRGAAVRETMKWIEYVVLFWVVCVAYRRDRDDSVLVWTWVATTLLVTVLALGQELIGSPWGVSISGEVVPRIAGPLEGPNQLAAYLEISLAVLCVWCGRNRLVPATIVVALVALALSFSRAGMMSAAIAIAIVLWFDASLRQRLVAPLATGVALAAASAGTWVGIAHVPGALPAPPSAFYAGGVGYRGELWRAAIALWEKHPLLGVGAGNYELELGSAGVFGVRTHANSWYLQSLAEGGLLLLTATIALVVIMLRSLAIRLREASPWQLAAFAASFALVVHQIVDYLVFYPKVGGTWWIAVALGASSLALTSARRR